LLAESDGVVPANGDAPKILLDPTEAKGDVVDSPGGEVRLLLRITEFRNVLSFVLCPPSVCSIDDVEA